MQDNDENIAILRKFRELGIQIALDDFGTGYSSLNYLRSFPFDKIKIDRCFVTDIAERKDNDAIIQAVVDLAGKLQMVTTAEGVENQEQLAKLRSSGCTQVQGFLFSKALPASELAHGSEKRNTNRRHDSVTKLAANQQAHEITPEEKPQRKAG